MPTKFPLPKREIGDPPQTIGPVAMRTLDMEAMTASYCAFLGIDQHTGQPLSETVDEMSLFTTYGMEVP